MSTQLSTITPSRIGDVYLTRTGLADGVPVLALFKEDDWAPVRTNAGDVLGTELQRYDIGGDDGTEGWPVTLTMKAYDTLYALLDAQRRDIVGYYDAVLNLAATDGDGNERSVTFSRLAWVDLTHDSAPSVDERFGARIYRGVTATLISEA